MSFEVTLNPSCKQFNVEDGLTVLEAAMQAKLNLPHSCRDGSCGTCKCRLLSGQVKQLENMDGLGDDELAEGYILTCVAKPLSDIEIESTYYPELDGIEPSLFPCKVEKISFPVNDIAVMSLRLPTTADFNYLPGQYIDLMWKGVKRSYSIANADYQSHGLELHIRRVTSGVFSQLVFEELKPATLLRIEGPHGTFFVRNSDAPIIFLAGGTGFAPVKAMVEKLLSQGSQRSIHIYWGVHSSSQLYMDLAEAWQRDVKSVVFTPVVSGIDSHWKGRSGLVHQAVMDDFPDLSLFEVYASGSPDMIASAKSDFLGRGLKNKNFFSDAFTPYKQIN